MPRVQSQVEIDLDIQTAFKLSQTYGKIRYKWDPFVKEQHLLDGATKADKGVRTQTKSKHGLEMISEYITYNPPNHVGMKMVKGPWFFKSFSGGWNFVDTDEGRVLVTWRYNFVCKPKLLKPLMEYFGSKILQRDIDRRLIAFKKACSDKDILSKIS